MSNPLPNPVVVAAPWTSDVWVFTAGACIVCVAAWVTGAALWCVRGGLRGAGWRTRAILCALQPGVHVFVGLHLWAALVGAALLSALGTPLPRFGVWWGDASLWARITRCPSRAMAAALDASVPPPAASVARTRTAVRLAWPMLKMLWRTGLRRAGLWCPAKTPAACSAPQAGTLAARRDDGIVSPPVIVPSTSVRGSLMPAPMLHASDDEDSDDSGATVDTIYLDETLHVSPPRGYGATYVA